MLDDRTDLAGELTTGRENQGLRSLALFIGGQLDTAQDIQHKGGRLSSTRL